MNIQLIEYTAFYAGLLALIYIALSFRVIALRKKFKIGISHGEEMELHRAIRVHGNFAEYVPIALLLMLLVELNQGSETMLHIMGSALLIGRILHAMGLSKSAGTSMPRLLGGVLTFSMLLVAAIMNVLVVY